jgi:hypothetical protein
VRKTIALACFLSVLTSTTLSFAADEKEVNGATTIKKKEAFWRGTKIMWGNEFSAYSLNPSADLSYNPYYATSIWLIPRIWIRDDLYTQLRAVFEVELTTSDETDRRHEWQVADLWLDFVYKPDLFTIPKADIKFSPNVRFVFPTSQVSIGRSMVMAIAPAFTLSRELKLHKGRFFNQLDLTYGFRYTKYFHKYANAQVSASLGCGDFFRPECEHSGVRNPSQNFANSFDVKLQITEKLSFDFYAAFFNTLLYQLDATTVDVGNGAPPVVLGPTTMNHTAKAWFVMSLDYDVFDWLSLSVGTSTYYGQLNVNSSYETPIWNRYTNFNISMTIPVDKFVEQVQSWAHRGRSKSVN